MTNEEWQNWNTEKAIEYSVEAVKAALLLNGGGAVAVLTLLGAVAGKEGGLISVELEPLKVTLRFLTIGMCCAAATTVVAYVSQRASAGYNFYAQQGDEKKVAADRCRLTATILQLCGLTMLTLSLCLFGLGVYQAPSAFTKSTTKERSIEFKLTWPIAAMPQPPAPR